MRRRLKFKKEFISLILSGRKRATIRLKKVCDRGDVLDILDENGNFVSKAIVFDIKTKNYSDLTLDDAVLDGFRDLDELKQVLKNIYGFIRGNQKIYIYFFKLI